MAQPTFNLDWYDRNGDRPYPFDDACSLVDDRGQVLPNSLLVDAQLRFPLAVARWVFCTAVTLSSRLVSLIWVGCRNLDDPADQYTALASLTMPQPVQPHRLYNVQPLLPGVGGWFVFGHFVIEARGFSQPYIWKSTTPTKARLAPRTARPFRLPDVVGIGKYGSGKLLHNFVRFQAGNDFMITPLCLQIDDYPSHQGLSSDCYHPLNPDRQKVILFSLDTAGSTEGRNTLAVYSEMAYARRPDSGTCEGPTPIERINTVSPDCCGNITLLFSGCAELYRTLSPAELYSSETLDSGLSVSNFRLLSGFDHPVTRFTLQIEVLQPAIGNDETTASIGCHFLGYLHEPPEAIPPYQFYGVAQLSRFGQPTEVHSEGQIIQFVLDKWKPLPTSELLTSGKILVLRGAFRNLPVNYDPNSRISHGAIIGCDQTFYDAARRRRRAQSLPDASGRLPSEQILYDEAGRPLFEPDFDSSCGSLSAGDGSLSAGDISVSESALQPAICPGPALSLWQDNFSLPRTENQLVSGRIVRIEQASGQWCMTTDTLESGATHHLMIISSDLGLGCRRISARLRLRSGRYGNLHNAHVAARYFYSPKWKRWLYFKAELDWDAVEGYQSLRILGGGLDTGGYPLSRSAVPLPYLNLNDEWSLTLRIWPIVNEHSEIVPRWLAFEGEARDLTNDGPAIRTPKLLYDCEFDGFSLDGKYFFGFGSHRSVVDFYEVSVSALHPGEF